MRSIVLTAIVAVTAAVTAAAGPMFAGQSMGAMAAAAQTNPSASPVPVQNARVLDAFGKVDSKAGSDGSVWKPVSVDDLLSAQTTLRTGDNAAALLQLPGNHLLRISADTTVLLRQLGQDNQYSFKVFSGQVWSMVRKANHPAKFEVETPSAVAGVTGTIFGVSADATTGETVVSTNEGSVLVSQNGAQAAVTQGNFLRVGRWNGGQPAGAFRLVARPQGPEMRQMWSLLHMEGVLVRRRDRPVGMTGFGPMRLQRQIERRLFQGFRSYHPGRFAPGSTAAPRSIMIPDNSFPGLQRTRRDAQPLRFHGRDARPGDGPRRAPLMRKDREGSAPPERESNPKVWK